MSPKTPVWRGEVAIVLGSELGKNQKKSDDYYGCKTTMSKQMRNGDQNVGDRGNQPRVPDRGAVNLEGGQ